MAIIINTPPMVGMPVLCAWRSGISARIFSPAALRLSRRMNAGPSKKTDKQCGNCRVRGAEGNILKDIE